MLPNNERRINEQFSVLSILFQITCDEFIMNRQKKTENVQINQCKKSKKIKKDVDYVLGADMGAVQKPYA